MVMMMTIIKTNKQKKNHNYIFMYINMPLKKKRYYKVMTLKINCKLQYAKKTNF